MRIFAPAKMNLNLRILGRRDDGYHEIETLMLPVSLADELVIDRTESGVCLTCDEPSLPTGPANLVCAAAAAFFRESGVKAGVRIHLTKRIPCGAGLGGGSSDAAATLLGLDSLFETSLGTRKLEVLAASLGSDVPWFIRACPAMCRGRGEIIQPIDPLPAVRFLLLKPPFGISTPWAYGAWSKGEPWPPARIAPSPLGRHRIFNDFEEPVFQKYPILSALKDWLHAAPGVLAAGMSGSGSTLFALLDEEADAGTLTHDARAFGGNTLAVWHVRVLADGTSPSPLQQ
jgi:4-diphosphocytidyl-2-C-methyl-D-erythritol kinase